jgi:hypothetical protein
LPTDPKTAEQNSLLLPLHEPRIYGATESFSVTYEGVVLPQRPNGRWVKTESSSIVEGIGRALRSDEMVLLDADAQFCDHGIEDADISRSVGKELSLLEPSALDTFANTHGDMVVLKSDFDDEDPYFNEKAVRRECGGGDDLRQACEDWFGTAAEPTSRRELLIREAYHNQLIVTPRILDAADQGSASVQQTMKRIHCCFPAALSYEVRAAQQWVLRGSKLMSNILPGPDLRCVRDCNPKVSRLKNRVFEISSSPQSQACATNSSGTARPNCFVGPADKNRVDAVCVLRDNEWSINPETLGTTMAKGCVLDSLKARFAIYRGLEPSVRDMSFTWTVNGGFSVLAASMTSVTNGLNVMPADMKYIESWDSLGVVDGESGGFRLFGLAQFTSLKEPYQ